MSGRKNFFFRQKVTESELDAAFNYAELAERAIMYDQGLSGIYVGFGVAQHFPVPDLTVDVDGPGVAYDPLGRRINFAALQNCDVSVDHGGTPTAVAVPGNEKWLAVHLKFKRSLSDPRLDGYGATVYFDEAESWKFYVTQGAEAPAGTAARPSIEADGVLLCDILLYNTPPPTSQVLNADIYFDRRQDTFSLEMYGRYPALMPEGQLKDALDMIMLLLDTHVSGVLLRHDEADADAVAKVGVPDSLAGMDVGAQIGELLALVNARLPLTGGTVAGDILPDTGGGVRSLGDGTHEWQVYAQDVIADGEIRAGDRITSLLSNPFGEPHAIVKQNPPLAWARISGVGTVVGNSYNINSASMTAPGRFLVVLNTAPDSDVIPFACVRDPSPLASDWGISCVGVAPNPLTNIEVKITNNGALTSQGFFFMAMGL